MIAKEAQTSADDMTVGFIIRMWSVDNILTCNICHNTCNTDALLGYNLTDATIMTNQYDSYVKTSSLKEMIKHVCIWIYVI